MATDEYQASVAFLTGPPRLLQICFEQHMHRLKYQPPGFILYVDDTLGAQDILTLCCHQLREPGADQAAIHRGV